jgi:hypothetical protein
VDLEGLAYFCRNAVRDWRRRRPAGAALDPNVPTDWADLSGPERADLLAALVVLRRVNEGRARHRVSFEALATYGEDMERQLRSMRPPEDAGTNGTADRKR